MVDRINVCQPFLGLRTVRYYFLGRDSLIRIVSFTGHVQSRYRATVRETDHNG